MNGGDIYNELLWFGAGSGLWMIGRSMAAAPAG